MATRTSWRHHHSRRPSPGLYLLLLLLLGTCCHLLLWSPAGTVSAAADVDDVVRCPVGFGREEDANKERALPLSQIDDGYCDCPTTGEDEPNTDACSGNENWPGRTVVAAAVVSEAQGDNDEGGDQPGRGEGADEK